MGRKKAEQMAIGLYSVENRENLRCVSCADSPGVAQCTMLWKSEDLRRL